MLLIHCTTEAVVCLVQASVAAHDKSAADAGDAADGNATADTAAADGSHQQRDASLTAVSAATATADSDAAQLRGTAATASQQPAAASPYEAAADSNSHQADDPAATQPHVLVENEEAQPAENYFVQGIKAIDVEVDCGPGVPCRLIHVVMDVSTLAPKPYLGGYKHKQTGAVYHHTATQTPKAPKPVNTDGKLCRQTQTVDIADTSAQTLREMATQMQRPGILIDESGDRIMTPRRYVTATEINRRQVAAALIIQRFTRGWFARRRAGCLSHDKTERDTFIAGQTTARQQAADENRRHEIERRMHPRSMKDFKILAAELETWRRQQTAQIKAAGLDKEKEQAALQLLLAKETKLLQTIGRLRVNALHENKDIKTQKELDGMAQPKTWELRNGVKVEVHTPLTTRAKELQQLYRGLVLAGLTVDERLDVLLHVKWTVKEFDCNLTREIVDLIDREADLLNRGRDPKTLDGLRKRIAGLFLAFCQTPEFNPEATRFKIKPADAEQFIYEEAEPAAARAPPVPTGSSIRAC
eukprot:jgi/Chrzof1/7692/Cz02g33050.t1